MSSTEARRTAGKIGGLRAVALCPDLTARTAPARQAQWQKYIDKVATATGITDEAELIRRAEMLRQADMAALSLKAASARKRAREAAAAEAELAALEGALDATGLADSGSDGIDA